ncbi:MAG TPA: PorV/PorQ family protein [bacterium]|nr:PorV/PorQ family protein [bacterium]HPN43540.1 PorV/PorQ family protein [bacterium]
MKYKNCFLFFLGLVFFMAHVVKAQVGLDKVAQSTMNFQLVSLSPQASAMGEAFCAVGAGAEGIFFNPAGMVETTTKFELKMSITQWIADINYMAGAMVWNTGNWGSFGFSIMSVDYGTINGTSLLAPGESGLYPIGFKDTGEVSNVGAYSFGLTYGRAISSQFFIAGNMRLAGQNLGRSMVATGMKDNNATKLVFDAGVKYYTGLKSFRFGMAIRNFSSNIKREEIEEQLPLLFTMGVAMNIMDVIDPAHAADNSLLLAVDFLHPNNYSERMNIGLEYKILGCIALRGGYQTNRDLASWSAGLGLNTTIGKNNIEFDYSYSAFDIFDEVNRFAIGIAF